MNNPKENFSNELSDDLKLLTSSLGGTRGMIESGAPALVFITAYALTSQNLRLSVFAAVSVGLILAVFRLAKRQTLSQVTAGFIGLAFSSWLAISSGQAQNFFLPGILMNFVYAGACLVSLIVNKPLIGYLIESIRGTKTDWLKNRELLRRYRAMTYLWFGVFGLRVLIMTPLYFANQIALLGFFRLALGLPLFALAGYITYAMSKRQTNP